MADIKKLTNFNIEEYVKDKRCFMLIYSNGCKACMDSIRYFNSEVTKLKNVSDDVVFATYNLSSKLSRDYILQNYPPIIKPAILFIEDGKVNHRQIGISKSEQIVEFIVKCLENPS